MDLDDPDPEVQARWTRLALETIVERIRPATWIYPALLVGYLPLVRHDRIDVIATAIAIVLQLGLAVTRRVLYGRSPESRAADPDRWRRMLAAIAAMVMVAWDAFILFEVWHRQLDATTVLPLTAALVLRSGGVYAVSPDLYFYRQWSRWSQGLLLLAPFVLPLEEGIVIAASFLIFHVYSEGQARRLNAEFWRRVVATDSLATAHAALRREVEMRERAEVELRLAQKLESVGRLAAGIAHEINTPLQAIQSSVAFLGEGVADLVATTRTMRASLDPARADDLDYLAENLPASVATANESLARAAAIVRSMKTFANADAAAVAPVDVNHAVAAALEMARHAYGAVADVVTELGELPLVDGHAGELNVVFLSLVENAAHAMAPVHAATGARGTLRVVTRADGDRVRVTIADTGVGIPAAIRDRIFDPFFTTKSVGKGTGQGLTVAHAVVTRRHGGELTVESEVGRGTTFVVTLPIARPLARAA
jgi:signal transduction histidine kinase